MGRISIAICVALVCTGTRVEAVDLTKIDRTIGKLPELRSESPEYCLLVFGPQAAKRVWLVYDGDVLYVDRNSNGDLTEPDERVAADSKASKPDENVYYFQAGEIPDEPTSHKDLTVGWFKVDHLLEQESFKAILAGSRSMRICSVRVDVAIAGQQGRGVGGRVSQSASLMDHRGWLQFAASPDDAPIIHFGGPWEVTLTEKERWRVGRTKEVTLVFGTPGLGPGTTACVAYDRVIPPTVMAKLKVQYPPASPDQEPLTANYELTRRCCTYDLYGDVRVPNDVGNGTLK